MPLVRVQSMNKQPVLLQHVGYGTKASMLLVMAKELVPSHGESFTNAMRRKRNMTGRRQTLLQTSIATWKRNSEGIQVLVVLQSRLVGKQGLSPLDILLETHGVWRIVCISVNLTLIVAVCSGLWRLMALTPSVRRILNLASRVQLQESCFQASQVTPKSAGPRRVNRHQVPTIIMRLLLVQAPLRFFLL